MEVVLGSGERLISEIPVLGLLPTVGVWSMSLEDDAIGFVVLGCLMCSGIEMSMRGVILGDGLSQFSRR